MLQQFGINQPLYVPIIKLIWLIFFFTREHLKNDGRCTLLQKRWKTTLISNYIIFEIKRVRPRCRCSQDLARCIHSEHNDPGVTHNPNLGNGWVNRIQIVSAPLTVIYQYIHTHECVDVFFSLFFLLRLPGRLAPCSACLRKILGCSQTTPTSCYSRCSACLEPRYEVNTHKQTYVNFCSLCSLWTVHKHLNTRKSNGDGQCSGWVQVSGCVFAPTVQSVSHTAFEIRWHWTLRSGCCALWLSISQTSSRKEVRLSFLHIP